MCLIIHRPESVSTPPEWTENALETNPDGWGIMAASKGKIIVRRGLKSSKFSRALKSFGQQEVFIHFRYATHGVKDVANTHPFLIVNDSFAIMHNGVLSVECPDASKSDTWHFANDNLAPILRDAPQAINDPAWINAAGTAIGENNKIVIMRADGDFTIINRQQGFDFGKCWLSNTYSIDPPARRSLGAWSRWDDTELEASDLEELSELSETDLVDFCAAYPEDVASAIRSHFRQSSFRDWR